MALKYWRMPPAQPELTKVLAQESGLSEFVTEILVNRGIDNPQELLSFTPQELELENPFHLRDMDKAVALLQQALEENTAIFIYGDYDCDGTTSTAMVYSYLSMLGANVSYFIPNRVTDGYGLNVNAVQRLHDQGARLLLTVDNGISAHEAIKLAKELGMKVIVTDHHQVGQTLPCADAVVNPHRKDCDSTFKDLAGVGVAFQLLVAMEDGDFASVFEQYGELLTIGTVGDLMPLVGSNRLIVQHGLKLLQQSQLPGVLALCEVCAINPETLTSQNLAFGLIPRINAAGRMADANIAVKLLLSEDLEEAAEYAQQLQQYNEDRKELETEMMAQVEQQIQQNPSALYDRVLTFYQEGWKHGVIGLLASRVLEKYGKPSLIMALEDGKLTGSARSVTFFPLHRALDYCKDHLLGYGGHTQAAGFSLNLEDLSGFKAVLEEFSASNFWMMPSFDYAIDKVIRPEEVNLANVEHLQRLEPFGMQNQQPLFLFQGARLLGLESVGQGKHLRLKLQFGDLTMKAMYFRMSLDQFSYPVGSTLDFLGTMQLNEYQDRQYLSVIVKDVHQHGFDQRSYFTAKSYYEMIQRNEPVKPEILQKMIPNRDELAMLYRHLKLHKGHEGDLDLLFPLFLSRKINYGKFRLMLDILSDAGLLQVSGGLDRITLCEVAGKVDLTQTKTMKQLQQLSQT